MNMDFVILKVNGQNLRDATHEQAIEAFRNAREPIVVEVARREWTQSNENAGRVNAVHSSCQPHDPCLNACQSVGVQTDLSAEEATLAAAMTAAAMTTEDIRAALILQPHVIASSETVYSSSASCLLDIAELDAEDDGEALFPPEGFICDGPTSQVASNIRSFCPCDNTANGGFDDRSALKSPEGPAGEDMTLQMDQPSGLRCLEFKEVKLCRKSPTEKFGLTLCYRSFDETQDYCEIYVGEIEQNTAASRALDVRIGDRIVQIEGELVKSRARAVELFSRSSNEINLLVAHQPTDQLVDTDAPGHLNSMSHLPSEQGNGEFMGHFERPDQDSGLGRTTDESARTEESSEQELEPDTKPAALEHDRNEHAYSEDSVCQLQEFICSKSARQDAFQNYHPVDQIDEELVNVGRLMQTLAIHCRQLVHAKLNYRDSHGIAYQNGLSQQFDDRRSTGCELTTNMSTREISAERLLHGDNSAAGKRTERAPSLTGKWTATNYDGTGTSHLTGRTANQHDAKPAASGSSNEEMEPGLTASCQTSDYCTGGSTKSHAAKAQVRMRLWKREGNEKVERNNRVTGTGLYELTGSMLSISAAAPSIPSQFKPSCESPPTTCLSKPSFSPVSNWSIDESLPSVQRYPGPIFNQNVSSGLRFSPSASASSSRDGLIALPGASESGSDCLNRSRPSGISNVSSADSINFVERLGCVTGPLTSPVIRQTTTVELSPNNLLCVSNRPPVCANQNIQHDQKSSITNQTDQKNQANPHSHGRIRSRENSSQRKAKHPIDQSLHEEAASSVVLPNQCKLASTFDSTTHPQIPYRGINSPWNFPTNLKPAVPPCPSPDTYRNMTNPEEYLFHPYEVYDHFCPSRCFNSLATHRPLPEITAHQEPTVPPSSTVKRYMETETETSNIYETPYASVTLGDEPSSNPPAVQFNPNVSKPSTLNNQSSVPSTGSPSSKAIHFAPSVKQHTVPRVDGVIYKSLCSAFKRSTHEHKHGNGQCEEKPFQFLNSYCQVVQHGDKEFTHKPGVENLHQIPMTSTVNENNVDNLMEWVVRKRPDGTRYITRRPLRTRLLKERAKRFAEVRCGLITDDDTISELRANRHLNRSERRRQAEKSRTDRARRQPVTLSSVPKTIDQDKTRRAYHCHLSGQTSKLHDAFEKTAV